MAKVGLIAASKKIIDELNDNNAVNRKIPSDPKPPRKGRLIVISRPQIFQSLVRIIVFDNYDQYFTISSSCAKI